MNPRRVITVLLAAAMLPGCGGGTSRQEAAPRERAGELVFLVPERLPPNMELAKLEEHNLPRAQSQPGAYGAAVGSEDGAGRFRDVVHVVISEATKDREISAADQKTYEAVDVNGRTARLRSGDLTGANLDWFQDGLSVGLIGRSQSKDLVIAVARALRLPRSGDPAAVKMDELPNGVQLIAERAYSAFRNRSYSFSANSTEPDARTLVINVAKVPSAHTEPAAAAAGSDSLRLLTVRDSEGALGRSSRQLSSGGTRVDVTSTSLVWYEYRDNLVFVVAGGLRETEVIDFAEGLKEVTEQEWRAHFERAGS